MQRVPGTTTDSVRYDDRDAVVRQSDSSGLGTRRLGNDALGRVVSDTLAGDAIARRGYGALSDTLFDRNGSKTLVTRDLLGRTVSVSSYAGTTAFTTLYFYTVQSDGTERDSVSYPDGSWEVTVLDRDGRTIQKQDSRGVSIQYTTDNDADTVAWSKGEESLKLHVSRDSLGRVSTLTRFENGTDVAGTSYTRDGVGRPPLWKPWVPAPEPSPTAMMMHPAQ